MQYTLEELVISLHERAKDIVQSNSPNKKKIKENMIFALDVLYTYDIGDEEFFMLVEKMNELDKKEADHYLKLYEKIKKENAKSTHFP